MSRTFIPALASAIFLSACYTSRPIETAIPPNGVRVSARLTEQASLSLAPVIGTSASEVDGVVVETRDNGWDLQLLNVQQKNGQSVAWNRERVTFPVGSFIALRERKVSTGRTLLFTGGIMAAAILLAKAVGLEGILTGDDDGNPQPVN